MSKHPFTIEETTRNGYIAWDAIYKPTGTRFPVNASVPYTAGTFPEITAFLQANGIVFEVVYRQSMGDSLVDQTWTYVRGDDSVEVIDIPRTIFRISR